MKKKSIILGTLALCCFFTLASCNNSNSSSLGGSSKTETPTKATTTSKPLATTTKPAATTTKTESDKIQLGVTVLYPDGTPLVGKRVQWCNTSGNCYSYFPKTDENGYASASFESNLKYYAHIFENDIPKGYTFNPYELKQDKNNLTGTLHLLPIEYSKSGDGTKANPYVATLGYNVVNYKEMNSFVYYSVSFTEVGEYTIESLSSKGKVSLGYLANDISSKAVSVADGGNDGNFKYSIKVTEDTLSKPFYFIIKSNTTENLLFSITK